MVSPCVPMPLPMTWINKRWSVSKYINTPSSWVKGQACCPIEECVVHDSPAELQRGSSSEEWTPTVLGYKTLEDRSKFTVYKILVTDSQQSWIIFRRYSEFCKLNDKLKELFPNISLPFPPKSWFKNKFEEDFLKMRQTGLQLFLEMLTLHKNMYNGEPVTYFLYMVNSPDLCESPDESRAFCEILEETNHRLQRALSDKQREVEVLKKTLGKRQNHLDYLMKKVKE